MPLVTTRASVAYGAGFGKVLSAGGAVDTGAMVALGMVQVGSAGATDITFSSIPSTYTHLQIRGIGRTTEATTSTHFRVQFNGDTGSNYAIHYTYADGTASYSGGGANEASLYTFRTTGASAASSIFGGGVMDILDYKNTNKYKTLRTLSGEDRNGNGYLFYGSGLWLSNSAITSIKLFYLAGNFAQYSQLALYGIKGA